MSVNTIMQDRSSLAIMEAVKRDGSALKHASEKLQKDQKLKAIAKSSIDFTSEFIIFSSILSI